MAFFGICYSPYHRTAEEPPNKSVTETNVDDDMKLIKNAGFARIRTYGVTDGNQWNVDKAIKHKMDHLGLGVWVFPGDENRTHAHIDEALNQVKSAYQKYDRPFKCDLVVGNEVNRRDTATWTPTEILNNMNYAKTKRTSLGDATPFLKAVRVTSCWSGTVLQDDKSPWRPVVQSCEEVVYLTAYPWYAPDPPRGDPDKRPGNIDKQMEWSFDNGFKQVIGMNKTVVIAEIGWPSAGGPSTGGRATSVENQKTNFAATGKWVSGINNVKKPFDTFWFEMFDEMWKTKEGAQGPHWGLYTGGADPTAKWK
jgi:exo-beta-1,3-glucanase (GH17 family)